MGGLGALVLALRNPDEYASVSAFSPLSPHRKYRGDSKPLPHILVKIKMRMDWWVLFHKVNALRKSWLIRS